MQASSWGVMVSFGGSLSLRTVVVAILVAAAGAVAFAAAMPASVGAHAERATTFPDPDQGAFPEYRTTGGQELVVCTDTTKRRIKSFRGRLRARHQQLLRD